MLQNTLDKIQTIVVDAIDEISSAKADVTVPAWVLLILMEERETLLRALKQIKLTGECSYAKEVLSDVDDNQTSVLERTL